MRWDEMPDDTPAPYRFGIDDIGDAPLGAENAPTTAENPEAARPQNPGGSEGDYRQAVILLLTEIRDLLAGDSDEG